MLKNIDFDPVAIKGVVQHYAWGGYEYIPNLIGQKNESQKPCAELWLGDHPKGPAVIDDTVNLEQFIRTHPAVLGDEVFKQFSGRLPFLLKILDARDMLSIQVHPSKIQAEAGFERENKAGIALDAGNRSYKDDNHKPEVHVALTEFWMLHGFRPLDEIDEVLKSVPEFEPLQRYFDGTDVEPLYRVIMEMDQIQVDAILQPLVERLEPLYQNNQLPKSSDDYWAVKASRVFPLPDEHIDRGIFSIYLFNLVHLNPGEGTFQDAGEPHAYLEGVNVELMANSDNVLRGGLTPKYIDVNELLKTVKYNPGKPTILTGAQVSSVEKVFKTPSPDFELSEINLDENSECNFENSYAPHILLALHGKITVNSNIDLNKGQAVFVPAKCSYQLKCSKSARIFKATIPQK